MKTFKNLISEVAEPKAGDEKAFKDKHIVTKVGHPVALDHQFTGEIPGTSKSKRRADLAPGEDAQVYEAMDPVNPKALKGKHKDRQDKDIDNDGDVDSSDEYLHKRRKAISNALTKEEVELDESITKLSNARLKYHATKGFPHGSFTNAQVKDEHKRRMKTEPNYHSVKPSLSEEVELDEAKKTIQKKAVTRALQGMKVQPKDKVSVKKAPWEKKEEVELDEAKTNIYHRHMLKALGKSRLPKNHQYTSAIANNGDFVVYDGGGRIVGRIAKGDHNLKEELEQLDELSPNKLHAYIKGASKDLASKSTMSGYDARSRAYNNALKNRKKSNKRLSGIASASGRLADKANMSENAWEEVPMMMRQLQFICYSAEEIMDYLNESVDPEEWFQNKLAHVHDQMQTLHAYAEGDRRMMSRTGMYGEEAEELDEVTRSATGQEKIKESLQEAVKFKAGMLKLRDGSSVIIKNEDADLLTQMFKDLSPANRKKMEKVAMEDKSGFEEILGFAREAL
jgi:hypothetical protein